MPMVHREGRLDRYVSSICGGVEVLHEFLASVQASSIGQVSTGRIRQGSAATPCVPWPRCSRGRGGQSARPCGCRSPPARVNADGAGAGTRRRRGRGAGSRGGRRSDRGGKGRVATGTRAAAGTTDGGRRPRPAAGRRELGADGTVWRGGRLAGRRWGRGRARGRQLFHGCGRIESPRRCRVARGAACTGDGRGVTAARTRRGQRDGPDEGPRRAARLSGRGTANASGRRSDSRDGRWSDRLS